MKKVMFNDKYGLTKAVLEGRKTMTRRIMTPQPKWWRGDGVPISSTLDPIWNTYNVGEVVAVAQSYESIHNEMMTGDYGDGIYDAFRWAYVADSPGWRNKMFVKANLMPHQIRITDIDIQLLHDISDEECLKEGIYKDTCNTYFNGYAFETVKDDRGNILAKQWYKSPVDAFAALIDKISGRGTWESNPWVFVYEFELVK